jgi:hypothetical protein
MIPTAATTEPTPAPTDILAAIDGTGSAEWLASDGSNSHVYKFERDLGTRPEWKEHFHGPNTPGTNVGEITDQVCKYVKNRLSAAKNPRLSLIGHSRGGLIAILAAKRLETPVHFLGLYDAVDRHFGPSGEIIPANVRVAYHARRDPSVQSRRYFGNCGTTHALGKGEPYYFEKFFKTSHGGIGGDPEGAAQTEGKHNAIMTGVATVLAGPVAGIITHGSVSMTVDAATARRESLQADRWLREAAKKEGLPIG